MIQEKKKKVNIMQMNEMEKKKNPVFAEKKKSVLVLTPLEFMHRKQSECRL